MTEEEKLVKEWVEKEYDELRYEKCECKDFIFTFRELKEMGKQAFLAGLKAKTQWHDLRKNPDDLPEDDGVYLVYTLQNEYFLGYYEHNSSYELSADGTVYSDFTEYPSEKEWLVEEVIAWCELPTFEE